MPDSTRKSSPRIERAGKDAHGAAAAERIADLAWAGQQERAIDLATASLAQARSATERLKLLDLRAESHVALGRFDDALADAQAMLQLANAGTTPATKARALCRLAQVQTRQGGYKPAARSARSAMALARKAGDRWLEALALFRQAGPLLTSMRLKTKYERKSVRHASGPAIDWK